MKMRSRATEPSAVSLLEDALHLLRAAPASALAAYLLGTLPFLLGLLLFWSEMTQSAYAEDEVTAGALAVGVLFCWKSAWQAVFTAQLRAQRSSLPVVWTRARLQRLILAQTILQPSSLFVIPLAGLLVFPFVWVYDFYQNATALAGLGEDDRVSTVWQGAWRQASLRQRQVWMAGAILLLLGFFVMLNLTLTVILVPQLLKTLLGLESIFTRGGPAAFLNTTLLGLVTALTYLCLDPIVKAMAVVRCWQGESLKTGDDLLAAVRMWRRSVSVACLLLAAAVCSAQSPAAPASAAVPGPVRPAELNRAIDEVLRQREYTWRLPRKAPVDSSRDSQQNPLLTFLESVGGFFERMVRSLRPLVEWIRDLLRETPPPDSLGMSGKAPISSLRVVIAVVGVLMLLAGGGLAYAYWHGRRKPVMAAAVEPAAAVDLRDESVSPDQLPESSWMSLAQEWLSKGDPRMALRALHLAGLAYLGTKELLSLRRWKTNHEYEVELRRRARALPEVLPLFTENVRAFERGWYGDHPVDETSVMQYTATLERIKTHADA